MATTALAGRIAEYVRAFDFTPLFIEELGWDRYQPAPLVVEANGAAYTLRGVAQKRGMVVLQCDPDATGGVPNYATRRQIEQQVAKAAAEHLIVFVDAGRHQQFWQWARRRPGQRTVYRAEPYFAGQSGEKLAQRLRQIVFDMSDEETLTLVDVTAQVGGAFDVERVTKKFYERFQAEHTAFMGAIAGIADEGQRAWYASLMLNRLMFTYFIQKKEFLDGDPDYLRNRLERVRALRGPDQFHSFYRSFLLRLFHDGLGKQEHERKLDAELARLIGRVPYLNGGLFEVHAIEDGNREIEIPDAAFARIFAFFDEYDWHLDDRPLRNDREINPDVLGYIFEKYINQKQMGAYYTKEDITGYIGRGRSVAWRSRRTVRCGGCSRTIRIATSMRRCGRGWMSRCRWRSRRGSVTCRSAGDGTDRRRRCSRCRRRRGASTSRGGRAAWSCASGWRGAR
jgi:hypothetical protein